MSLPGQMNVLPSAAAGDMQMPAGNFAATPNVSSSGAFTYSIPIQAPPGTHGMVPHLALTYSSAAGDGSVGIGWSISGLSAITRCPQTVAQDGRAGGVNFDSNDRFCLDGKRLRLVKGTYGADGSTYQTEISNFAQITAHGATQNGPAYFTVVQKNGVQYQYGNPTNSNGSASNAQIPAYGTGGANLLVRIWALNQVTDTAGNYMAYTYSIWQSGADYTLARIDYTGNSNAGTPTYNYVKFNTVSRSDAISGYQAGYLIRPQKLVTSIQTYTTVSGTNYLRLTYTLTYHTVDTAQWISGTTGYWHNELSSVQVCDHDSGKCLNPTSFTWQGGPASWSMSDKANPTAFGYSLYPADFNGDGLTDALIYNSSKCQSGGQVYYGSDGKTFTNGGTSADYWYGQSYTNGFVQYDKNPACFQYAGGSPWIGDVNGDGLSDVMLGTTWWQGFTQWHTYSQTDSLISGANGSFTQANANSSGSTFVNEFQNPSGAAEPMFVKGDMSGDGLTDAFALSSDTSGNVWANFWIDQQGNQGTFSPGPNLTAFDGDEWLLGGDFDGNGCTDIFSVDGPSSTKATEVLLTCTLGNESTGFTLPTTWNWSTDQFVLGDFNGDGKTDVLVVPTSGAPTLYLSAGTGLVKTNAALPTSWDGTTLVVGDFNADGKADIASIQATNIKCFMYLSTGIFSSNQSTGFVQSTCGETDAVFLNSVVPADWNNDGATDLWIQTQDGSGDEELLTTYQPELMTGVTDGVGATIAVSYQPINTGKDKNGAPIYQKASGDTWPVQDVNGPVYVVTAVTLGGGGTTRGWTYSYAGLLRNVTGRGTYGFNSVAATDQQTNVVTTTQYYNSFPLIGLPHIVTSVTNGGNGTTLSSMTSVWGFNDSTCTNSAGIGYVVCLESSDATGNDIDALGDVTAWPEVKNAFAYDGYGNVQSKQVTYADGSVSTTAYSYDYFMAPYIVDALSQIQITNNIVNTPKQLVRTYTFTPNSSTGEITQANIEPNNNQLNLEIDYGYDSWGNIASTTYSGAGISQAREWQFNYNDTNYSPNPGEFVADTTNPLSQVAYTKHFSPTGEPSELIDLNGHASTWSYDNFGRPLTAVAADGTEATISYYYCTDSGAYACPANAMYEVAAEDLAKDQSTQNGPIVVTYYDALNRVVERETQGLQQATNTCWIAVNYTYDALGYLYTATRPYFTGQPSNCTSDTVATTTYTNDIFGRVTKVQYTNRVDQTEYKALTTVVSVDTSGVDQSTTTTRDDEGWIISVSDANNGNTQYAYDAFGDPLQISSPGGATVTNTFDIRGRKRSTQSPDMGTWSYTFDALNELTQQTSPIEATNSQYTALQYDLLGRLVSRSEPDMASSWHYDGQSGQQNAVGLLDTASCSGGACAGGAWSESYSYDSKSRPSSLTITPGNQPVSYTSSESYDPSTGRISSVTGFSAIQYTYQYAQYLGYPSSIVQTGTSTTYWTANDMDAELRLKQETAGNGIVTNYAFDPTSDKLAQIYAGPSQSIANLSFYWDDLGNLKRRDDNLQSFTENFCYDDLNRLSNYNVGNLGNNSCTTGGTIVQKSMGYDGGTAGVYNNGQPGDGNITEKSDVGAYTYGQSKYDPNPGPHAVTSIATCSGCNVNGQTNPTFSYDADGNMISDAGRTASYTSFDLVSGVGQGNNTVALGYTPEHQRGSLTSAVAGTTLYYLNNPAAGIAEEFLAGTNPQWRTYLRASGHIVAELFTTNGVTTPYYFVVDHLTSTTALTNANGAMSEYDSYDAWGKRRAVGGSDFSGCIFTPKPPISLRGYTGEEMFDSSCLVNLNARLYDPSIGRMMGGDPLSAYPFNGQNLNAYSYALNEPLALSDRSGMCPGVYGTSNADLDDCGIDPYTGGAPSGGGFGQAEGYGNGKYPTDFCLSCNSPTYYSGDALGFLPFGGFGQFGGGFGGFGPFGSAQHIGSISGPPQPQLAANDIETVIVYGSLYPSYDCCSDLLGGGSFTWDQAWASAGFLEWNPVTRDPGGGGGLPSIYRYTAPGETFYRYETDDPRYSRIGSLGQVSPGTFAAPSSDGVQPLDQLDPMYQLTDPQFTRSLMYEIAPPAGTLLSGPGPVQGGFGNEVTFPAGAAPGSVTAPPTEIWMGTPDDMEMELFVETALLGDL